VHGDVPGGRKGCEPASDMPFGEVADRRSGNCRPGGPGGLIDGRCSRQQAKQRRRTAPRTRRAAPGRRNGHGSAAMLVETGRICSPLQHHRPAESSAGSNRGDAEVHSHGVVCNQGRRRTAGRYNYNQRRFGRSGFLRRGSAPGTYVTRSRGVAANRNGPRRGATCATRLRQPKTWRQSWQAVAAERPPTIGPCRTDSSRARISGCFWTSRI